MTAIRMALDSILEKKGRSFLTMLGIIIGVTAVLVLVALVEGYNADITAYYEKMGVNKAEVTISWYDETRAVDYTDQLEEYLLETYDSTIITGVSPIYEIPYGAVSYGKNITDSSTDIVYANDQYAECGNYTLDQGRDFNDLDMANRNNVCILGSYVTSLLFQYADPIGETVLVNGTPYTVVGTYYAKDGSAEDSMDDVVVIPYSATRADLNTSIVTDYIVKINSSSNVDKVITTLEMWFYSNLSEYHGEYEIVNGNSAMSESQDEMTSMSVVLGGVAGIALLVGGIGIMNIMLVTVSERTREIGIKKAIGAPRSNIISQFLVEAGILSALGGVIGVVLGYFLAAVLGKMMYDVISFPDTLVTVGAFTFSVVIGVAFGLYPAAKAAGLQPVDALRVD